MTIAPRRATAFGKYAAIGDISLKNKIAYRGNFLGSLLTYGLFVFVFSRIWAGAYSSKANISGYDYSMSVWYFIVAEVSVFGFGRFFWRLADDIKSGAVAYLLGRPYSFVGYHFAEIYAPSLFDAGLCLVEGIAIGIAAAGLPSHLAVWRVLALLASLVVAGALQFFLQMAIAMTAFWVEENTAFFWIFQKLALVIGTLLPIEFLPPGIQKLAWCTPLPSLSYAPARIAVAATPAQTASLIGIQCAWLAASLLLCRLVFGAGKSKIVIQGG
jgi:ABC-2 type transport system permease protein